MDVNVNSRRGGRASQVRYGRRRCARHVGLAAELDEALGRFDVLQEVDALGIEDGEREAGVDVVGAAKAHDVFVESVDGGVAAALHGSGTIKQNVGVERGFAHACPLRCLRVKSRRLRDMVGARESSKGWCARFV